VILLLPILFVGWRPDLIRALILLHEESGPALTLILFYVLVLFVAPPLLLIVAVSARETTQIISPAHWSRCFAGRGNDVFLIYVLYIGALFTAVALSLPAVVILATITTTTLLFTLPLTVVFAAGAAVLLLGGLCGEYAHVPGESLVERQAPSPVVVLRTGEALAAPLTSRKPPLLDAGKRVAETNHDIAALEALRDSHAPNPAVLHALAFACAREGRHDDAIAIAREAIPLAVRSGGVILAAELFDRFHGEADFGVPREQVVAFADALRNSKRLAISARLYTLAIESQPGDVRAIKGAMATAEELAGSGDTAAARQLYDFLLERCAASPLMDFVRERRTGSLTRPV